MGQDPQVPVVDRLIPSLVAVQYAFAASPSWLVVEATYLLLVPAHLVYLACLPALRRPHTVQSDPPYPY